MTKEIMSRSPVTFHIFGPFEVFANGKSVPLCPPLQQRLAAKLLAAGGQRVQHDELMDWMWDNAPTKPRQALYEVTADLRRWLGPLGLGDALISKGGWLQLKVDPESVDVHRFHRLVGTARALGDGDRAHVLAEALREARDEPLAGMEGRRVDTYRQELTMKRRDVELQFQQLELRAGNLSERMSDLDQMFRRTPDDSRVVALYMYALYCAGSPASADKVYQAHQRHLARRGMRVPPQLHALHERMLSNERDLGPQADEYLGGAPFAESASHKDNDAGEQPNDRRKPVSDSAGQAGTTIHGGVRVRGQAHFGPGDSHYYEGPVDPIAWERQ